MLVIEDVSVRYDEGEVVSSVSLSVAAGQVACLLGRNGVGKTTLLKAIMGVLPLHRGRVVLGGADISRSSPGERARAGIGYVPQGRGIFPQLSVRENLAMGLEALPVAERRPERIEEALAMFPGLRPLQRRAGGALSGGQQQQLALARVLLRGPKLLLLDEPTEGIQPSIMREIAQVIRALAARGEVAILLVEQFLDFALEVADDYAILERGTIVARGATRAFDERAAREFLSA